MKDAAERAYEEMDELKAAGFKNRKTWETVRERCLFKPEEPALKAGNAREPVASEAARTFNEIMRAGGQALREA